MTTLATDRRALSAPADLEWFGSRAGLPLSASSVLMHAPSHAFQAPGGGEIQLLRTARSLADRGVDVRPFVPWADRLERARLIHLFGMSAEGLALARVARSRRLPVALSPICWLDPRALWALAPSTIGGAADLVKWGLRRSWPTAPTWRRELLRLADVILPNSVDEADQLIRLFGARPGSIAVVPNGVDERFTAARSAGDRPRDGVLYVGRIEPRKNVLRLVEAARRIDVPLRVIGNPVPGHEAYADDCRARAGPRARFDRAVAHDDPRLVEAYAGARVLALPSWFETPGLAALEAALAGCALVVTPYGSTRSYFGERAVYIRPGSVRSIADGLARALDRGPAPGLADHVRNRYLWPEVARRTAEAYDRIAG